MRLRSLTERRVNSLSDLALFRALDLFLGGVELKPPERYWVGLSRADYWSRRGIDEPRATAGYSRVEIPNNAESWYWFARGVKSNLQSIEFPTPTADWGKIVCVFLAESATEGPAVAGCNISRYVGMGESVRIAKRGLKISMR